MKIDARERDQIRAALAFWNAVAKTSAVHPATHPAVPKIKDPMTPEEVDRLIARVHYAPHKLKSLRWAEEKYSVNRSALWTLLNRNGVHSVEPGLWAMVDLIRIGREMVAKRDALREKYSG